ncbi:TPA: caspase family protein [Bacillus cereus]|uniref:caspase family protein n=1 Tax=Bacillus TaxID=1386 RepID=UPI0005E12B42|nr:MULTISPECIES: caspase family protein [Bacillus]CGF93123.1 Uncharacterized protein containing caspase domain [Streptococcus pneumoniae]MDZ4488831.1 caspase family protein [Bacillus cereus]NSL59003.1 caspase family protein [Bacillus cereus]OPD51455.1 hypothetical protein BVG00_05980 [Bacillus cereus]TNP06652.1 caspase family protein [Bacillus cereus]
MNRLAYVVGISEYIKWPSLKNPVNDAETMKEVLENAGFDVKVFNNTEYATLSSCIAQFKFELRNYDIGLFYFAGHGIEINGDNYLIPSNAEQNTNESISATSVNISSMVKEISLSDEGVFILILDACRTKLFTAGVRGFRETGLKNFTNTPIGTFISFATGPDSTASDGNDDDSNGLYTKVLSSHILVEGLKIEELFKKVRKEVVSASKKKQIPWEHSSLMGDFYFIEPKAKFIEPLKTESDMQEKEYADDYEEDKYEQHKEFYYNTLDGINQRIETIKYKEFYIVSKVRTQVNQYTSGNIHWWGKGGEGYTDNLKEAGKFSKEDIKGKIEPYNFTLRFTKSFAIPVQIVDELFEQSNDYVQYNRGVLDEFESVEPSIIGDLEWNLPEIMY